MSKNFRKINKIERKIISNSISKISPDIINFTERNDYEVFILLSDPDSTIFFPLIFLVPNEILNIIRGNKYNENITSSGLYFGMIKKGRFYLSLESTEFLFNHGCFSNEQEITINKPGEKAILYGNKILKRMLIEIPKNLKKNNFLLFFNESHELLSIGNSLIDYKESQKIDSNGAIANNLVDKGYYLRRKQ